MHVRRCEIDFVLPACVENRNKVSTKVFFVCCLLAIKNSGFFLLFFIILSRGSGKWNRAHTAGSLPGNVTFSFLEAREGTP